MNDRVIYMQDNGVVAVIVPSAEALASHTIQEIADKDVPPGKPYKIIDIAEVPSDRYFRDAWEANPADLTDGVGNQSNQF